ncbi:MAG: hypothetical protein CUN56_05505 [Phototrophicales bacterium]|nr:MAG: hypothetical protein CUN56_05505 [Phototrophicales bacterium]RMG74740.1 MAG: SH3 domain-containing protein [Chloroflexota bacterium]
MRQKIIFVLILILGVIGVQAQNQTAEERVDQAMAHLSQYLGLNTPITRQTHYWSWEEVVYNDSSFGCPVPGRTYPATPNRALNIIITYQGTDYNYRISWDGSIMVLCGANGVPLYRSDDPTYAPSPATNPTLPPATSTPPAIAARPINAAGDALTWVYMQGQRVLYLLGLNGEIASVQRPSIPNENIQEMFQMSISRNGRYLLQVVSLTNGGRALGIYDFQTGQQRVIPAQAGEEISLGFGTNTHTTGNVQVGSPLIFNATSTQAAVTFANVSTPQPGNNWRVAIVDLASGTITQQLTRTDAQAIFSGTAQQSSDALQNPNGSYFPQPIYFNDDGGVHFQLYLWFTGGAASYPALVWYPTNNTLTDSPYTFSDLSILPTDDSMIYPELDANLPASSDPGGMLPNYNVIRQATINNNNVSSTQNLLSGSPNALFDPNWAADGTQVVYRITTNGGMDQSYTVLDLATQTLYQLPNATVGAPGGVITVIDEPNIFSLAYYRSASDSQYIWDIPPQNGDPVFVWVKPAGATLELTSVAERATTEASIVSPLNPQACGAHENNGITIGVVARTTFVDGLPLNLRTGPGTSGTQVSRLLPEGETFLVIAGPRCADGYTWWNIRLNDGSTGWVAQAGQDFYWIEPVPSG